MAKLYRQELIGALDGPARLLADGVAVRALRALSVQPLRYSQFRLGVSTKTLASRLKALERDGLITRTIHAQVPPRVEYAITPKGEELLSILQGISQWEQSWQKV